MDKVVVFLPPTSATVSFDAIGSATLAVNANESMSHAMKENRRHTILLCCIVLKIEILIYLNIFNV